MVQMSFLTVPNSLGAHSEPLHSWVLNKGGEKKKIKAWMIAFCDLSVCRLILLEKRSICITTCNNQRFSSSHPGLYSFGSPTISVHLPLVPGVDFLSRAQMFSVLQEVVVSRFEDRVGRKEEIT